MLEGIPVATLTPSALLGIFVLMMFLGKVVPRSTLQDKIDESNNWRKAYEAEREARATSDAQSIHMLEELTKTTDKIVADLFGAAERARRSGEADALQATE